MCQAVRRKRASLPIILCPLLRSATDLRTHLYRMSGVDFTQIDGLGVLTVQTILSEGGLDPSRFPSVKHFTS